MKQPPKDLVASIQARLLQHSRTVGVEHQLTLVRFAGERLLYRLAASEYAGKFVLSRRWPEWRTQFPTTLQF